MTNASSLVEFSPHELQLSLQAGDIALIDVREPFEHAEARIEGATLHTLSSLDVESIRHEHGDRHVVFHCKAGGRSAKAASQFQAGDEPVYHLAGGIDAWIAAGFPVVKPDRPRRLPIMRQVQITAGTLVAIGTALGAAVSPWFLVIPGFVGCGLVFAGASGWCGMAKLLAAMPWNRTAPGA